MYNEITVNELNNEAGYRWVGKQKVLIKVNNGWLKNINISLFSVISNV